VDVKPALAQMHFPLREGSSFSNRRRRQIRQENRLISQ
jgi:hypothetical protein